MWRTPLLWYSKPIRTKPSEFYPVVTKQRKWKTFTLHHIRAFMSVTIPCIYILPSLHQDDCFDLTAETWHAALPYMVSNMSPSLYSRAARLKKTGRLYRVVCVFFFPSPFKSTLQRAPLWPLMHPVHLARQSCETQDHRHGQKQFHPLIEPISTLHFETGIWYLLLYIFYIPHFIHCCSKNIKYRVFSTLVVSSFNNICLLKTQEMFIIIKIPYILF